MSNHLTAPSGSMVTRKEPELAVDQQRALELLLTGQSVMQAAQSAGVSRATLYRWLRHDPVFQSAYNQWQDQLQESCRSRLLALSEKAAAAIEKALENGDAKLALQLLKGLGLLSPKPAGPTDIEEVREQMQAEKEDRRAGRATKRLMMQAAEEMTR